MKTEAEIRAEIERLGKMPSGPVGLRDLDMKILALRWVLTPSPAAKPDEEIVEAKDEAVNFVFDALAKVLGLPQWVGEDGSETWEGDVMATLRRLLRDSGAIDPETDIPAAKERDDLRARADHAESFCYRAAMADGAREFVCAETVPLKAELASYRALLARAKEAMKPFANLTDALVDTGASVAIGLRDSHLIEARALAADIRAKLGAGG